MSDDRPHVPRSHSVRPGQQARKTLITWLVMMATFIFVYGLFSASPAMQRASKVGVWVGVGCLVLFLVIRVAAIQRQARQFVAANNDGIAMLVRGDLVAARQLLFHWSECCQWRGGAALARHNLAWTMMRQGEIAPAIDVLLDNERLHRDAFKQVSLAGTSAIDLALDYALLGDTAKAEASFAEAERRNSEPSMATLPAMKLFARAVIDCRIDRCSDAARYLDEHWAECEALLTGGTLRPLRVIRAFAHSAAGPRNAGLVDAALANMRPAFAGEFTFLGVAWPEMATFLAAHQLS